MRRRPFDRFQEISRNFKGQGRIVALHSKASHLLRVRGGLKGPEYVAQRCLTHYFERNTSIWGGRVARTDLALGIDSGRMTGSPEVTSNADSDDVVPKSAWGKSHLISSKPVCGPRHVTPLALENLPRIAPVETP